MSLKRWILSKVNGLTTRVDLPRSPVFRAEPADTPSVRGRAPATQIPSRVRGYDGGGGADSVTGVA